MDKRTYYQLNRERINNMNKERYWKNKKAEYVPTEEENEAQFRKIQEHIRYTRELDQKKEQVKKNYVYY